MKRLAANGPQSTQDLHIAAVRPLIAPAVLQEELPLTAAGASAIASARRSIAEVIAGRDRRLLVVVGPCSIHDPSAAVEYAQKLRRLARRLADDVLVVMRVYFEKPRTIVGWKGLINDPGLDGTFRINEGLRLARRLLLEVNGLGLPAANEFLDTTIGQYYADLISWGCIGARTVESQVHRELASGLSMPVGFKNRTDGDIKVAIDAMRAAHHPHWFPSLTLEGAPAVLGTTGNRDTHLVLRGGSQSGPNFSTPAVAAAVAALEGAGQPGRVMIDCSHANSGKDPERQLVVAADVAAQVAAGSPAVLGLMLESHLVSGRQELVPGRALVRGQSITDACLGWRETVRVLERLARVSAKRRRSRRR
ncbi:MAG: 3-deoxy-7-phosphoheptulonate synthase [Opitutaceae bacterium]|nr:3-deoxy-7-phosphoheptulonate synthase [Opitutaceae bacterium]